MSILLDGLLLPPLPSNLAAILLTLPVFSMSTPPFTSGPGPLPAPGSVAGVPLTELILFGGGGGGPLRLERTANEWLRLMWRWAPVALESPRPGLRDNVAYEGMTAEEEEVQGADGSSSSSGSPSDKA